MYNFSGLWYRIWAVCGLVALLGIICLLIDRPWKNGFRLRSCVSFAIIAFALCMGGVYVYRIVSPDISTYSGEFIKSNRNSRVAPPLPFTFEYVFWNGEGERIPFYLDADSRKEIIPDGFEEGQEYTIYFDTFTNIIVKVEVVEKEDRQKEVRTNGDPRFLGLERYAVRRRSAGAGGGQ